MVEKPYLAKSNGIGFRNFGHKQGIQVRRRNPWGIQTGSLQEGIYVGMVTTTAS